MSNNLAFPDLTDDMLDMIGNFPYETQTDAQAHAQTYVPRESTHPDFYFNFKEEIETFNYVEFEKLDTFMNTFEWEGFCRPKRTFKQITFKSKVFRKKEIIPTNFWEYSNKIMSPFQYMLIPKFNTKNSISPLIEKSILPLPLSLTALPSPLAKIDESSEDAAKEYVEENQSAAEDDSDPMKEMEIRLMCDENIDEVPQLQLPVRIKRKYIKKEKGSKVLDKKKYKKRKKNTDDSYNSDYSN